jgi:hypothetical protein
MCNTFLMENNFCCCYSTMLTLSHVKTYVTKIFKLALHFTHDAFQNFKVTYYMLTKSVGAAPKGPRLGGAPSEQKRVPLFTLFEIN